MGGRGRGADEPCPETGAVWGVQVCPNYLLEGLWRSPGVRHPINRGQVGGGDMALSTGSWGSALPIGSIGTVWVQSALSPHFRVVQVQRPLTRGRLGLKGGRGGVLQMHLPKTNPNPKP